MPIWRGKIKSHGGTSVVVLTEDSMTDCEQMNVISDDERNV